MRLSPLSLITLLLVILLSSCTSCKTAAKLNDIETFIQDHPDSALATIRAIDTTTLTTRSIRAHYALLNAMAIDKNWIDTTDKMVVMPAIEYYDRHPCGIRRAMAWYYLGRIQENSGDIPTAHISFLKAEKWANGKGDDYFMALVWQSLSNTYGKSYLNQEALHYSELSLQASSKIRDTSGIIASQYRIAQDLNNLYRYEEADSLYQLLVKNKRSYISPHLYPAILSDYALLRLQHYDDNDSAVNLFEEALKESGHLRNHNLWGAYAYALLRTGNSSRATTIFRLLEAADNDNSLTYKIWKARADAFLGNYASAYDKITIATDIQQANVAQVLKQSTLRAQMTYREQEIEKVRQMSLRRNLILGVALILLLFFAAMTIIYLKKRNKRITADRESLLESFRSLSSDYARINENQATIRAKYIAMFRNHFGQIGQFHYLLLRHSQKDRDTHLYHELRKAIGNIQTDTDSQQQFEKILNASLDEVMIRFRESFPDRKPRYYQLASFLFAGFDATIISNILLELSKDNVYVEKSRLKKMIRESNSPYKDQFLSLLS